MEAGILKGGSKEKIAMRKIVAIGLLVYWVFVHNNGDTFGPFGTEHDCWSWANSMHMYGEGACQMKW